MLWFVQHSNDPVCASGCRARDWGHNRWQFNKRGTFKSPLNSKQVFAPLYISCQCSVLAFRRMPIRSGRLIWFSAYFPERFLFWHPWRFFTSSQLFPCDSNCLYTVCSRDLIFWAVDWKKAYNIFGDIITKQIRLSNTSVPGSFVSWEFAFRSFFTKLMQSVRFPDSCYFCDILPNRPIDTPSLNIHSSSAFCKMGKKATFFIVQRKAPLSIPQRPKYVIKWI